MGLGLMWGRRWRAWEVLLGGLSSETVMGWGEGGGESREEGEKGGKRGHCLMGGGGGVDSRLRESSGWVWGDFVAVWLMLLFCIVLLVGGGWCDMTLGTG